MAEVRLHFSDYFGVDPQTLKTYGAFNVSLINDLPLFVDPFLLFNSSKPEYKRLHDDIIQYLRFLRDKSDSGGVRAGLLKSWYAFPEVRQNWLGFSRAGNAGHGLGADFANSLHRNLGHVFRDFGEEATTRGSHLEKLCLLDAGVGKDGISDFTTNLIKGYLLDYTQRFAREHLSADVCGEFRVDHAWFNYETETWASEVYDLPMHLDDYVILTPRDMLTREEMWISRSGFVNEIYDVIASVPNAELRDKLNNYLIARLPEQPTQEDRTTAVDALAKWHPAIIDHFVRRREDNGDRAVAQSDALVARTYELLVDQAKQLADLLSSETGFYANAGTTAEEARARALFLKDVVENKGGHRLFYDGDQPIQREEDLHILYRLTWHGTTFDVSREVNDGRGPADFKISMGAGDKTVVEFKRAANPRLKRNLEKQIPIYQRASDAQGSVKVIFYFTAVERKRVEAILDELEMMDDPNVVLVDARRDNKPSGSKA